jgi:hypothetical protein
MPDRPITPARPLWQRIVPEEPDDREGCLVSALRRRCHTAASKFAVVWGRQRWVTENRGGLLTREAHPDGRGQMRTDNTVTRTVNTSQGS